MRLQLLFAKRTRSLAAVSLALLLGSALVGAATHAQPALFSGGVKFQDVYGSVTWVTVPTASAPAVANVTAATPAASVMVPAGAFNNNTVFPSVTYIPGFPNLTFKSMSDNGLGTFGPGYFVSPLTQNANTTSAPNPSATPRSGFIRLIPGVNGFGGAMPLNVSLSIYGTEYAQVGYYDVLSQRAYLMGVPAVQGAIDFGSKIHRTVTTMGGTVMTGTGPPITVNQVGAVTAAPWITGMATAQQPLGAYATTVTRTGVDGRNAAGTSGPLSMVSPALQHRYDSTSGGPLNQQNARGIVWEVSMTMLPEPGGLVLLASGCAVLIGLRRRAARSARAH